MLRYNSYIQAEEALINHVINNPTFITSTMHERICEGFILTDINNNQNKRSNYEYAKAFFDWLMTGEKELSPHILELNPWVKRFVSTAGLPESFSSSYGWKIKSQMDIIMHEISTKHESRRGYVNILYPDDCIILGSKTTHEYPCTIGFQLFNRGALHMVVNMRSNNLWSVMPYDVYNFTMLQKYVAEVLELPLGNYYHTINSAHVYNGDVRRIKNLKNLNNES